MSGGSPFQTFFLMFKSNAKEAEKDMKSMQKTSDEVTKHVKKTKEETGELGKAFTSAVEDATRALAAYVSFQAFKTGIVNAQEFNRTLTIQTKLWGQNANEINSYGAAVKAAGGDMQGFFGWYDKIRQQNASIGRSTLPLGQLMAHIRQQVKDASPEYAQMIFQRYGISDAGQQTLLRSSDSDYSKSMSTAKELTKNTEAAAKASQEFGTAWDNMSTSANKFWTTVNTVILPPLTKLIDGMGAFFTTISNNQGTATAFFITLAAVATIFTASVPAIVAGFGAISAAALAALPIVAALAAAVTTIVAHKEIAQAIDNAGWNPFSSKEDYALEAQAKARYKAMSGGGAGAANDNGSAMQYLLSKGIPATAAAGIVANMQHESGGDINARGDGGAAHGLFQWHPDRRAKILSGTRIDVSSASMTQQLDAAIWELKSRGQYDTLLNQPDAASAGSYFSQKFEVPAGGIAEAMKRGRTAMDIAGSTPFASQTGSGAAGGNVTIGKIDVVTQATDAAGIVRDMHTEINRQIGGLYAQNNDAIAY